MNSLCRIGVVVHVSGSLPGQLDFLISISTFLSRKLVSTILLVEALTVKDAVAATRALQSCTSNVVRLSITQPSNTLASLNSALAYLCVRYDSAVLISCSKRRALFDAGLSLGCCTLHLDPMQSPSENHASSIFHIGTFLKSKTGALCVGYAMKSSRADSLDSQGMLPFLPIDQTFFVPIDVACVAGALQLVDVFLHKPTDFLERDPGSGAVPLFSPALLKTLHGLESLETACMVVDPLSDVVRVLDRVQMATILDSACTAARKLALPVRSPAWTVVSSFPNDASCYKSSGSGWPSLPFIVKPQVACGVDEAHHMALVLHPEGFPGLEVPTPAIVQEYVDHGGVVWKVYVLGEEVFISRRRSTPDVGSLLQDVPTGMSMPADTPACIEFHSLETLPVSLPWIRNKDEEKEKPRGSPGLMRPEFLQALAGVMRHHTRLTLFGFDVIFDFAAGEAVVVDINFFPSFRGIDEAPAALRATLHARFHGCGGQGFLQ